MRVAAKAIADELVVAAAKYFVVTHLVTGPSSDETRWLLATGAFDQFDQLGVFRPFRRG